VQGTFTSTTQAASGSAVEGTILSGNRLVVGNIAWTFNTDLEWGYFANGRDVFVIDPGSGFNIDAIEYYNGAWNNGGATAGSVVNVSTVGNQSLTSSAPSYNSAGNIATSLPYTAAAGQSIVSTSPRVATSGRNTYIDDAEILTILASAPAVGSFRPPYSGNNKAIQYNKSDIDYTALANMVEAPGGPTFAVVENYIQRPWVEMRTSWSGRQTHPANNMGDYGADMAGDTSVLLTKLNCAASNAEKENLAIYVCQSGLDLKGHVDYAGADWGADGGHNKERCLMMLQ
jgi:hypothetical protein